MTVQCITGKSLLYFRGVQLNLKTHLRCHLVPRTYTDTTSLTELDQNMYVHYTSTELADRFALCSFTISLGTLRWIRNLYTDYLHFRLPQRPHDLFADSTLERLYPIVVLTSRLSQMFPDAKAIGVTAALYSRLAGLPSGGGGKREMLRLAWERVNKLISTRGKQTHLLTWKKDGNYGWINSLCLHPMDLMCL